MYSIEQLVAKAKADGASDIHLICNLPPKYRKDGVLQNMTDQPLTAEDCIAYAKDLAGTPEIVPSGASVKPSGSSPAGAKTISPKFSMLLSEEPSLHRI